MAAKSASKVTPANGLFTAVPVVVEPALKEDTDIEAGYYFHNKKLGEGGFSKVRLATHVATGEKVAIKCMDKKKLGNDLFRVKTEINALKTLQHEHIAKLYQVIETETSIFLVLEYCSGGELFDYIVTKHRLSENESRKIMRSLVHCLAYIHQEGYAHRDLKPENILFDGNQKVKLIDFGLAAHPGNSAALAHLETCCGSPAYAAPELIAGYRYSGPAVDVWSTGVLLYALLVGQLPFDDENISNLYKKIKAGNFMMPVWLSNSARNLIKSMLQVDPKRRVTIKDLLKNEWICKDNAECIQMLKDQIDEELIWETYKLFKGTPIATVRQNVISGLGYMRATYWILKGKQESHPSFSISPQNKLTFVARSSETISILEQIKEEKGATAADIDYVNITQSDDVLNKTGEIKERASCVGHQMKRKLVTGNENKGTFNVYEREDEPTPAKARYTPSKVRQNPRVAPRPPTAPATPVRMSLAAGGSKDPRTPQPKGTSTPVRTPREPKTPQSMSKTPNNVLSPVDINKKKTYTLLSKAKEDQTTQVTPIPNRKMKLLFGKSPAKENSHHAEPTTPTKQMVPSTPKRSLMKRILAAATPSEKPRTLNTKSTAKNITMTNFTEAQECIDELVKAISMKGYACKQKGYTISCAKVNKYSGEDHISFDLEICQFGARCAILRKRLRGDAWFYKKICEEILRVSNGESTVESQV